MDKEELQKHVKVLKEGFLGKQRTQLYKRPEFQVRPLEDMLRDIVEIPPENWYKYVFSREPLSGKFTDAQKKEYMIKALECGKKYAEIIRQEYASSDSRVIAEKMGLDVQYPEYPENANRVLFGEFREPNKINIYMDAVNKSNRMIARPEIREILTDRLNVAVLLLAHELFHHIEELYKSTIYTKTEKIRLWSIGIMHNDSTIVSLSEIAAMGFAQELTGIPYSPFVMDVFLVYGYSPEEASGLYEEMMEYINEDKGE